MYVDPFLYGWVRFCHASTGSFHFRDPDEQKYGTLLYVDRCVRLGSPTIFTPSNRNRSCYLNQSDLLQVQVPGAHDGAPILWVSSQGTLVEGCDLHP